MVRRPVVCGRQLKITGDADDMYFQSLEDGEVFADDVIALLTRFVGADWITIDVGANIGLTSLALSILAPAGCVHSFEPVPRTAAHLRKNVEANGASNVEVQETALGSKKTELHFYDNPEFAAGSLVLDSAAPLFRDSLSATRPSDAFITVPCTTLDDFVETRALTGLDLIKIDAEGFELDVLAGAARTLAKFQPCAIVEFSGFALAMHRNMLPQDALAKIRTTFHRAFVLERETARLREIVTDVDACDLIYDNLTQHPIHDLFCAFNGSRGLEAALAADGLGRRIFDLEREVAGLRETVQALTAANARLESSMSWRVTAPLRRLRAVARLHNGT